MTQDIRSVPNQAARGGDKGYNLGVRGEKGNICLIPRAFLTQCALMDRQIPDAGKEMTPDVGASEAVMLCPSFSKAGLAQSVPASYPYRVAPMIRHGQENYPLEIKTVRIVADVPGSGLSLEAARRAMKWHNRSSTQSHRSPPS